jgi:hypothetical protein
LGATEGVLSALAQKRSPPRCPPIRAHPLSPPLSLSLSLVRPVRRHLLPGRPRLPVGVRPEGGGQRRVSGGGVREGESSSARARVFDAHCLSSVGVRRPWGGVRRRPLTHWEVWPSRVALAAPHTAAGRKAGATGDARDSRPCTARGADRFFRPRSSLQPRPSRPPPSVLLLSSLLNNSTVVGLRCKDGVVLGVENPFISKMVEPGSASRAYAAARHAGLAVGGVDADGRAVAGRAQAESVAYKK